jgi:hypothetical protein
MPKHAIKAVEMGRKKRGPGEQPPTVSVKIDRVIAHRAKLIAADRGIETAAFLSEILRLPVDREWAKMVKRADEAENP